MRAKTVGVAVAIFGTACCSAWAQAITPALDFHTLTPCRVVDTRSGAPLASASLRILPVAGICGVPATARAVSANVTIVGPTGSGFVKIWPGDLPETSTSTINFSTGMTRANNAVLTLATDGSGGVLAKAFLADSGSVDFILDVMGYMASAPVTQCQCLANGGPLVLMFGIAPSAGNVGEFVTIFGQNFAPHAQLIFGDATTGSSATLVASSSTSITAMVPPPPPDFTFSTEPCDDNGDGIFGTRFVPTPISVNVWNLDGTDCVATLNNAFLLSPTNFLCMGDSSTPPQVSESVGKPAGPSNGTAAGSMAGVPATECQCPANGMLLPQIAGVTPPSGYTGAQVTISGQNFGPHVQVIFGDPTTGSSANIGASSSTSITATVPVAPPGFTFSTEPCDINGDGIFGTRAIPTPIAVNVRNLDANGCMATLSNGFTLNPPNAVCNDPGSARTGFLSPLPGLGGNWDLFTRGRRSFVALTPGYILEPL